MVCLYYYTARTSAGEFVHGSLTAASEDFALGNLRARRLFVTSLQRAGTRGAVLAAALQGGAAPKKQIAALYRALAALVAAGVPIRRALDVTIEQCSAPRLREPLASVRADIEGGCELSLAMARRPLEFPKYVVSMVQAGEAGGVLDAVLERVAGFTERDTAVQKRIQSAAAYPAVVACTALALVIFLMTTIVPTFESLYREMRVPLPPVTRALIILSSFITSHAALVITLLAGLVCMTTLCITRYRREIERHLQCMLLRVPVLGALFRNDELARLARLLGTLLQSGVCFSEALALVESSLSLPAYVQAVANTRAALDAGQGIGEVLARSNAFDGIFIQLIHAGEETGTLDGMLMRLASYYDLEVETALHSLSSIVEPLMIVVVGCLVGGIIAAIFIPLYTLIGNIR
ncbi:MAG TPA: type II secretion system F family protein [Candidatus Baltobacteraceae bacterium]|jgi:type IV pilus assembly protein PilC|nr:type II secretion system F family protein [Candidatus Baltobacteraceae bacterium]